MEGDIPDREKREENEKGKRKEGRKEKATSSVNHCMGLRHSVSLENGRRYS